ncbi:DNA polymerase III subunit gamma/tau [Microbulbifer hydrolyticus]|uniref:DNA polymerase III subunit gamma/tau n=1 Tax=Microbulbifer hydrolyticus TaxID=48074 RepID=A0A6P1TFH3_9GAMM|nr:DNA polymerase III subunit gamma/tau [Microbulbifer hydrolyticus]MBB5212345.1 DNA polymerase-3 subunit gamma/tau [Microbulbifer hydrolyticus]QHQ39989.1 DNA polymerase III subunit gamma/tau [Microbulbifer hydrolyticus]
MSYQVLARKWRPRLFREMVGQEHVLQALINALDNNRLHHAYLFAGTRGVGKTTIARILAKCLNCETGVSSEPCGQCSVCTEIADGRFVDLIEVDAASRTKVEDTRELLENVQYAPTRGRYKVYLIDEVHMLSNSSFNALLKTLEEPPPHVKFLLATTDPQKLPVTVLSRCLQFNLKNMSPERVVEHLRFVLEKELVPFEEAALWHLGRAADGSMRDAMSLTDQAIAFGGGKISEAEVRAMLGTLDSTLVWKLIRALAEENPSALFAAVDELSQQAPDYSAALAELAAILHRIAIAQVLPGAIDNALGDAEQLQHHAASMAGENVQLFYQMALLARRDLPLAPDPRGGFEMALLRMLAFKPQGVANIPTATLSGAGQPAPQAAPAARPAEGAAPSPEMTPAAQAANTGAQVMPQQAPQPPQVSSADISPCEAPVPAAPPGAEQAAPVSAPVPVDDAPPWSEDPEPQMSSSGEGAHEKKPVADAPPQYAAAEAPVPQPPQRMPQEVEAPAEASTADVGAVGAAPHRADDRAAMRERLRQQVANVESTPSQAFQPEVEVAPQPAVEEVPAVPAARLDALSPGSWPAMYPQVGVTGILHSIASHLELLGRQDNILSFTLDQSFSSLYDEGHQRRLADVLGDFFGQPVTVQIQVGEVHGGTPARLIAATREAQLLSARDALNKDPLVHELQTELGAQLVPESVEFLG